jgi:glycosyltransferase involved in cell wall biosynthesis
MKPPRYSIVITSHNQSAFVVEAVASALEYAGGRAEILVVDDASTDESPDVLRNYGERIQLTALTSNLGSSAARNAGAAKAAGDYIVFLDGDDVLLPWALDVYDRIIETKRPAIILSQMAWFDEKVKVPGPEKMPRDIQIAEYAHLVEKDRRYQPGASAIVIEKQAFRDVGGWTSGLNTVEDVDLMLKLGTVGLTIQVLAPETKGYRVHGTNVRHRVPKMVAGLFRVLDREKAGDYPGGAKFRFDRHAILGAPVRFWIKSAYRAGLYGMAVQIFLRGWPMLFAAFARKIYTVIFDRKAPETLAMPGDTVARSRAGDLATEGARS